MAKVKILTAAEAANLVERRYDRLYQRFCSM